MNSLKPQEWTELLEEVAELAETGRTLHLNREQTAVAWGLRHFEGDEPLVRAAIKAGAEQWIAWDADDMRQIIDSHTATEQSFEQWAQHHKDELYPDFPEHLMRQTTDDRGMATGVDWEYFGNAMMTDSDLRVDVKDGRVAFFERRGM